MRLALQAGKHVVCEKPLATCPDEAAELAGLAAAAGVVAAVPFVYRFYPTVRHAAAMVARGEAGPLWLLHGSYLQDWLLNPRSTSWRVDPAAGGPSRAFGDIGSHWCDLVEWVTGDRIASLVATTSITIKQRPAATAASFSAVESDAPLVDVTTEDSALILFRTAKDVAGSAVISQLSAGRKNRLWVEVDGMQQSAVFDQENPNTVWLGTDEGARLLDRAAGSISPDQQRLDLVPSGHPQGYPDAFAAFLADTYAAVRAKSTGGPAPEGLPTFRDGLRAARIIDAVLTSSTSHDWTSIPD